MPTRNVNLTDHLDGFIERLVKSGSYANASEVVREALRLLELRAEEEAAKLARLRAAIEEGFAQIERGEFIEFDSEDAPRIIAEIGERAARKVARKA